jgi:pimeloyl-ACP methyl ester carboxylesterase
LSFTAEEAPETATYDLHVDGMLFLSIARTSRIVREMRGPQRARRQVAPMTHAARVAHGAERPIVVLVHGTRDRSESFDAVVQLLPEMDIVRYDRRGWGDEPWDGSAPTIDDHADDLLAVIGDEPVVVVGHSWGGNVVLAAAIHHPETVRTVGIFETSMPWAPWWPAGHKDHIAATVERVRQKTEGTPRQRQERALFASEASQALSMPYDLNRLEAPCVAGYGTKSYPDFAIGVPGFAKAVRAQLYEITDVGHMAHREHPELFAAFVRRVVEHADRA